MNPFKWIADKLTGRVIKGFGIIGKSLDGTANSLQAILTEKGNVPKLMIKGRSTSTIHHYELDITENLLTNLKRLTAELENAFTTGVEQISHFSEDLLEDGPVPARCAKCGTGFTREMPNCPTCINDISREKRYHEMNAVFNYFELYRRFHL